MTHFTSAERSAADALLDLALVEDIGDTGDLTCHALIGPHIDAEVDVVARSSGVVAGMPICEQVFRKVDRHVCWIPAVSDGTRVLPGQTVARVAGRLSGILTGERTALNFLGCLSGIATLTSQYVDAIAGTSSVILDTRKTLPGWRVLAKYAVRAGGGCNHRMGLHDGVLIKDNHIAAWSRQVGNSSLAEAVRHARATLSPRQSASEPLARTTG